MKKSSIAETTLRKQVNRLVEQITAYQLEAEKIGVCIRTLVDTQETLEDEIETLRQARITASELRK